jgi:hypothetical protein
MTDQLARRMRNLQEARELDDIDEAAYERGLAKLRAQYGDAAVNALRHQPKPASTAPNQSITNTAPNQGAQGIFYGTVYIHGQRGKSATEMIGAYLQRQLQRCDRLPLQGVYQQKAADDVLQMSLEQVYTQLALQHAIVREEFTDAALAAFDASAYLDIHRGEDLLPGRERTQFIAHGAPSRHPLGDALAERSLATLDADDLARLARESKRLQFLGPQLVTEAITTTQHLVLLGEPGSGKVRRMTARVIARNAPQVGAMTCEVDRLTGGGNTYGTTACR